MRGGKLLASGLAIAMASSSLSMIGTQNIYAKEQALLALASGAASVVEVEEPQDEVIELEYKPSLDSVLEVLPDTLSATVSMDETLSADTQVEVPVTWECEQDYDEYLGKYEFTAVIEDATVEEDVELPTVTVVTQNEEAGPVGDYELIEDAQPVAELTQSYNATSIPSEYDTRKNGNGLPALRDQDPYGVCWAFGAIGALEADLIASGQAGTSIDLSELALAYFTCHSYDDPLDLHNDDTIKLKADYLQMGGNIVYAVNSLSNGVGAVSEEDVPYSMAGTDIDEQYALGYNMATMVNHYSIPITDTDGIKSAIMEHGGVNAGFYLDQNYYSATNNSYYYNQANGNHAVMLVGWNDNFEKENFSSTCDTPSSDGAWLVRNSWLDGSDSSNSTYEESLKGYFWISYEDAGLLASGSVDAFDTQLGGYDNCYAYDGAPLSRYYTLASSTAKLKEIYPVRSGEEVKAVSVKTGCANVTLDATVTAGDQSVTGSVTTTYAGDYRIELDDTIITTEDTDVTVQVIATAASGSIVVTAECASSTNSIVYSASSGGHSTVNGAPIAPSGNDLHMKLYTDTMDEADYVISSDDVTLEQTSYAYTGEAIEPAVTVEKNNKELTLGSDYTVTYTNNEEVGTATATITGCGNYNGTAAVNYTITQANLSGATVAINPESYEYSGVANTPEVTVTLGGRELTKDTDYTISYANNIDAGEATVTITGKGNYTGTATATYTIEEIDLSEATVTLEKTSYIGTGEAIKPDLTVTLGDTELVKDTDYTVSYVNNIDAGEATVTVTGKGNYTGTATATFTIGENDISKASVSLEASAYTYTGAEIKPGVTVILDGKTLTQDTDYEVTYQDNTDVGEATVTISGRGTYANTATATFTIGAKAISEATVTLDDDFHIYTGEAIKPQVTVVDGSMTLVQDTDYTVAYSDNVEVGEATVTVTGKGNYTGTATTTYTISDNNLSGAVITTSDAGYNYTGEAVEPTVTVTFGDEVLTEGVDYTVEYTNNVEIGEATATITGIGDYAGTTMTTYAIEAIDISDATVSIATTSYIYVGLSLEPEVTVTLDGEELIQGTDYVVSYENNKNAGTAKAVVTGVGVHTGSTYHAFAIKQSASTISLAAQSRTYTGKAIGYSGTVKKSGSTGKVTYSYYSNAACTKSVSASNVKNVGTYYVKARLAANTNYAAANSAAVKLTITKASNSMKVSAVKKSAKYQTVKKKSTTVARPLSVKKANGSVTYAKSSGSSRLTVSKKTGKVTVKKKTKKGTYTIKIKVSAAGDANHYATAKTVKCKVVVK
ncbi:MAG: hypothetical protein K6G01_11210 [Eubacterium sp.]|nr:hypothetical protein [Eubacterium sp.]